MRFQTIWVLKRGLNVIRWNSSRKSLLAALMSGKRMAVGSAVWTWRCFSNTSRCVMD